MSDLPGAGSAMLRAQMGFSPDYCTVCTWCCQMCGDPDLDGDTCPNGPDCRRNTGE